MALCLGHSPKKFDEFVMSNSHAEHRLDVEHMEQVVASSLELIPYGALHVLVGLGNIAVLL